MGRRRAQLTATALLSQASSTTHHVAVRRFNCSQSRSLSSVARRRPLARDTWFAYNGRRFFNAEVKDANIAVLGGGLTGLTTAYYLAKQLPSTAKITLYEGGDRLGGWIRTEKVPVDVDGKKGVVSFERGPRSLTSLAGNTWRFDDLVLYDLCLDLGLNWVSTPNKPRYVYYPDHIVPLPPAINIFQAIREPLFTETIWGAIGLLFRTFKTRRLQAEDKSVAEWIKEVSGSKAVADHLVSSLVHGIYGGDIDKLSARYVLDRIFWGWYIPNPGAGARAMPMAERDLLETLGKDPQVQKMALEKKGALLHFGEAGMESLTIALAQALKEQHNVTIKRKAPITKISYDTESQKVKVSESEKRPEAYDKVISTLTSKDLSNITQNKLPSLSTSTSVSIMTVNIWYPYKDLKPPGFGYLIPRSVPEENNPERALGVFFDSDVEVRSSEEPEGTKLFVLMGGHYYNGKTPPTEEEAIKQAKTLLERQLGIPRDTPCHAVARLAKDCIPQHNVGHHQRMLTAHQELQDHFGGRLAVAGGSYTRIGAIAALRSGYDIATHTSKQGLEGTGLEALKVAEAFAVVPVSKIPVRRFR